MQTKDRRIMGVVFGLAVGLAIGVVVSLQAGPLTPPPTAVSGGTPVSTMKTLDQIPSSWDRKLPANTGDPCNSSRFTCVLFDTNNIPHGVRDNETGLVWMKNANLFGNIIARNFAHDTCASLETARRTGWRLPKIHELSSLVDRSQFDPTLPVGHPFENVQIGGSSYWSSSVFSNENGSIVPYLIEFASGSAARSTSPPPSFVWCVRGH